MTVYNGAGYCEAELLGKEIAIIQLTDYMPVFSPSSSFSHSKFLLPRLGKTGKYKHNSKLLPAIVLRYVRSITLYFNTPSLPLSGKIWRVSSKLPKIKLLRAWMGCERIL